MEGELIGLADNRSVDRLLDSGVARRGVGIVLWIAIALEVAVQFDERVPILSAQATGSARLHFKWCAVAFGPTGQLAIDLPGRTGEIMAQFEATVDDQVRAKSGNSRDH